MTYFIILTLHLLCAIIFIGTVFFEVLFLRHIEKRLPKDVMQSLGTAVGGRAKQLMPWVLLVLFGTGISMGYFHSAAFKQGIMNSHFTILFSIKILLAISVLIHFISAMILRKKGLLKGKVSHHIHTSVFCHVLLIAILAKAMFYL
ncbi:CopD family copper resistance protein [Pelistega suis]|uniref:CopD family copper resistance protein n=1 Tax=Pelistega suis TaxID=1631957 RepID=UPI00211BACCA|nr:hypothetical protein [Pelistega suis]MCQ9328529.1 hypothetical protein [Pelistega suis]